VDDPEYVVVAGDWHADAGWAKYVIERAGELLPEGRRVILQLGDFGVGSDRFLHVVSRELKRTGAELWFVDGNHENHHQLAALQPGPDGRALLCPRVWWLPRGHRWEWHGLRWLALGGAVSLDRVHRREGKSWWPEESITQEQVDKAIAGGPADVMVTHDCPMGLLPPLPVPPAWWAAEDWDRCYTNQGLVRQVMDEVRPSYLMHGHLHVSARRTVSLRWGPVELSGFNCNGESGNWGLLNTAAMTWSYLPLG
jgi:hypothetical protein